MIAITSQSFLKNEFLMNSLLDIVERDQLILAPKGPILAGEELYQLLKPAKAVLCGRELLDEKLLKRLPNLKFILNTVLVSIISTFPIFLKII